MPLPTPPYRSARELITTNVWNGDIIDSLLYLLSLLPSARVYNSGAISVAQATPTLLTFDSERYDNDTIHDNVTNPGRLTCRTAGKYHIFGSAGFASLGNPAESQLRIQLNGATLIDVQSNFQDGIYKLSDFISIDTIYNLAINDYVELLAYNFNSGGVARNVIAAGNYSPEFGMHRIG